MPKQDVAESFPLAGPVTKRDVAAYFRCSPDTVDRHVAAGMLPPPARVGAMLRWDAAEIRKIWVVTFKTSRCQPANAA